MSELLGRGLLITFSACLIYLTVWLIFVPLVPLISPLFPSQLLALVIPTGLFVAYLFVLGSYAAYLFFFDPPNRNKTF